ncbi:phytoene/squalene synthase family protein [Microbacterium indicum]|uniref:phytoene/squalene synthase family protein n=1 Tax=Microbacterium indicum TaxID=358100 RepID=UPI0003FF3AA9
MTGLGLYTGTARVASARVIAAYSTSFAAASRLLSRRVRGGIADIYALVRVADEIVDGPAAEAGVDAAERRRILGALEEDALAAMRRGFSANIVVHAFATTAREVGIEEGLVVDFFASMRTDVEPPSSFDDEAYRRYIHGSAEVVGTMCLRVFMLEGGAVGPAHPDAEEGARRLGAAFQKVNFLRDLADDCDRLGRRYFPGVDPAVLTDAQKDAIVDDIESDLAAARLALRHLPRRARRATVAALGLFSDLNRRLGAAPAERIRRERLSVPRLAKTAIVLRAIAGREPR